MNNCKKLALNYKVVFADAYGVFNFGAGISENVLSVFEEWIQKGLKIIILSNTTATAAATEKSYAKKGVLKGVHYSEVMTSGQYAYESIQNNELPVAGNKFYVFGTANFKNPEPTPAIFANSAYQVVTDLADADFIYCGIPQIAGEDRTEIKDFEPLIAELLASGLPMVCANPDRTASEDGRFVIRQGTIATLYEQTGGKVIWYGKPDAKIYDVAHQRFCPDIPCDRCLMIGDTVRTDILGANRAGISSALVIEGGVTEYELQQRGISLHEYLAHEEGKPDFIAQRVCQAELF